MSNFGINHLKSIESDSAFGGSSTVQTNNTNKSIFDVDTLGNNNGVIEEDDFEIALSDEKNNSIKDKIIDAYVDFMITANKAEKRIVGSHTIYVVKVPFSPPGTTFIREVTKQSDGKIISDRATKKTEKDGLTTVTKEVRMYSSNAVRKINSSFQYIRERLENYVINDAVDAVNNKLKIFSSIPEIRNIPENKRTPVQKERLKIFEQMIDLAIKVGEDYGVDPKLIITIMQKEVGFDGFGKYSGLNVTGSNGKGYMQLTSSPILDFLNCTNTKPMTFSAGLKEDFYGPEFRELLTSAGFNPDNVKTPQQKIDFYKKIMNKLTLNNDPEFNIRLGTLVLRYKLNNSNGDIYKAARNYNGNVSIGENGKPVRENYGKLVADWYGKTEKTVPSDSTYVFTKEPITKK